MHIPTAEKARGALNPNFLTTAGVMHADNSCTTPTIMADILGENDTPVFVKID